MLKQLRLHLTLLYLLVGIVLIGLVGAGTYSFLFYYFQSNTDLVLQHRLAREYQRYGVQLPDELAQVEQYWGKIQINQISEPSRIPESNNTKNMDEENQESDNDAINVDNEEAEAAHEYFDADLAPIFVYAIQPDGQVQVSINYKFFPIPPNLEAVDAANNRGYDWRTVRTQDGTRVRLLTYRMSAPNAPSILQLGRLLNDQDRVLEQFLIGLSVLGIICILVLGIGSWWLAGRSLKPTQRAWEQQQVFVANASHELRTPLTLIRAGIEVALRGHPEPKQAKLLQDTIHEVDHINHLVDDLLLLSRLDARRLNLESQPIAINILLKDVHRQVERLAEKKNVHLILSSEPNTAKSIFILGDETRLRQVLLILLDNALKHTPAYGKIDIIAERKGRNIRIIIEDNGHGIPTEHLEHIFERFYQAPGNHSDENQGSGLGLSIAKSLVESQGGNIWLESQVEKGTRVTITLPVFTSPA